MKLVVLSAMRGALILLAAGAAGTRTLCRTAAECGVAATGLCGDLASSLPLGREQPATICLGFQGQEGDSTLGKKAMFQVKVDHYATLSVDTLRPLMGAAWTLKEPYSQMWLGINGRRTIGQELGLHNGRGQCNASSAAEVAGVQEANAAGTGDGTSVCYGWAEHNKPVITRNNMISKGMTAIVHLDMGVVTRIMWDSSCNLCGESAGAQLSCDADGTNVTCVNGPCMDCYAQLQAGGCGVQTEVCAPKVYVAWLGTDVHGQPLLSAGSVLSRFQAYSVRGVTDTIASEVNAIRAQVDGAVGAVTAVSDTNTTG